MTFRDAIKAHAQWKLRLELFLSGDSSEKLDPEAIGRDDLCDLGKWIHSPATAVDAPAEFEELKVTHATFHRAVSHIVKEALSGHPNPRRLEPDSEYSKLSMRIIMQLKSLQRRLGVE